MLPEGVKFRLIAFGVVIALMFTLLVGRLWQLQVVQGEYYLQQSEENRLRDLRITAPRGILYDRKGRPLVTNRAAFTVSILSMELRNPDQVLPRLAEVLQMPEAEIRARMDAARGRPFEPVRLRRNVPKAVVARVEENRLDLPGVIIEVEAERQYLYGALGAHLVGYLGEVSADELATRSDYHMGDLIGKMGVERFYDRVLRGHDGRVRVEVDARGRPLRILRQEPAEAGRSIVLTLDLDVQRAAEEALGDRRGAVVALDPRNGEILALASHPSFDPNTFAGGISAREWARLTGDRDRPLLNRATDTAVEPGSVFKVVTAAAALTTGNATRYTRIHCGGSFRLGGWVYKDLAAHGTLDFINGVARSCNVFFYTLGYRTGGEAMAQMARALGLGEPTGIDLPSELAGVIPDDAWKRQTLGEPWYPGDSVNMSIGQGWVNVTPVQVARMIAAVGTGGLLVRPHLVRKILGQSGAPGDVVRVAPVGRVHFAPEVLRTLHDALLAVVERGTGTRVKIEGLAVAGKTGSAENPRGKPHAWFAAYAPADEPRVAVAVFIEHGFRGGLNAAPVAKAVLEAAFGLPLSPLPEEEAP